MNLKYYIKFNYKKYLFIILIIFLSLIYLCLYSKYDFIKKSIYKDNNIKSNFSSKLLYTSLNKIVTYNDMITISSENDSIKKASKIIKIEEKKEENSEEENNTNPIVYIYNTHDTETYSLPFVSDYSITPTVKVAAYILKDYLNDFKIESTVEKRKIKDYLNKNKLNYTYSYLASRNYMKDELKIHDYKILIDLHRDSATKKYTSYEKDGKKYARIMFVLGHDYKTYKKNEEFMNKLNTKINKYYKGLSRGIFVRKTSRYNQDLSNYAILIEVGGVDSTLEEINNSMYAFAKILSEFINEEIYGRR